MAERDRITTTENFAAPQQQPARSSRSSTASATSSSVDMSAIRKQIDELRAKLTELPSSDELAQVYVSLGTIEGELTNIVVKLEEAAKAAEEVETSA